MFKKVKTNDRNAKRTPKGSPVFSYHSSRSGPDHERGRYQLPVEFDSKKRQGYIYTAVAVLFILVILWFMTLVSTNPVVSVVSNKSDSAIQRPPEVYEQFISSQLRSSSSNRNKLTFNSNSLSTSIQSQFPEVSDVVVTMPLVGNRPHIHLLVSTPAFILSNASGAYYISNQGVPLVKVSDVTNRLQGISTVADESGVPIQVGKQVLPVETVSFIREIIRQMEVAKMKISSLTLPQEANELQLRLEGKPYVIRFNTMGDPVVQAGSYLALNSHKKGDTGWGSEYIDVRVEGRVYFK